LPIYDIESDIIARLKSDRRLVLSAPTGSGKSTQKGVLTIDFKRPHRHGVFITDDGYLISNYHVVKDATKVRLLTSAKGK